MPVERIAGGRAAVFHEGTISLSHAIRAAGGSGSYSGHEGALRRDGGDDRRGDGGRRRRRPCRRGARRVLPGRVQRQRPRRRQARRHRPAGDRRRRPRRRGDRGPRSRPGSTRSWPRSTRPSSSTGTRRPPARWPPSLARTTPPSRLADPDPLIEATIEALRAELAKAYETPRRASRRLDPRAGGRRRRATTEPRVRPGHGCTCEPTPRARSVHASRWREAVTGLSPRLQARRVDARRHSTTRRRVATLRAPTADQIG